MEDAGKYVCSASNTLGKADTSCRIFVHGEWAIVTTYQYNTATIQVQNKVIVKNRHASICILRVNKVYTLVFLHVKWIWCDKLNAFKIWRVAGTE